jgi:hypothetical protein
MKFQSTAAVAVRGTQEGEVRRCEPVPEDY